jgi:teichuronic acid biosynthesis glycosyltransferase TuaG
MQPVVSVITPLYQGEKYIAECIRSVLAQGFGAIEHIIIDNNSTDKGPDIVREYMIDHPNIRLLSSTAPGAGPARNTGLEAANGKYIAFLDADDYWHHDKIKNQITKMQDRNAVFSWTAYTVINESGHIIRVQAAPDDITYRDHLFKKKTIGCLTVMFDRHFFGERRMNKLPMRQDFCLWLDLLKYAEAADGRLIGIEDPLAFYRVHRNGLTNNKKNAARYQWRAYREHAGLSIPSAALCFAAYFFNAIRDRLPR